MSEIMWKPVTKSSVKRLEFIELEGQDYMRVIWFETNPDFLKEGKTEQISPWYKLTKVELEEYKKLGRLLDK